MKPFAERSSDVRHLYSKGRAIKVRVELFNITEDELYYPNMQRAMNCHSARHSLALFLQEKDDARFKNRQFVLYMRPLLTYPGDKEYTLYYSSLFNFPTVILTREENLSWFMQVNGLHKIGAFGRWCTRVFKIEPAFIFYYHYFYPWQYKLTIDELKAYCKEYKIYTRYAKTRTDFVKLIEDRLKTKPLFDKPIPPPTKTRYEVDPSVKYPIFKYNQFDKEWAQTDTLSNTFPEYEYSKDMKNWKQTHQTLQINNVLQLIGINKYHSPKRKAMNPNVSLSGLSNPKKEFYIYNYYPIYDMTPERMLRLIEQSEKSIEPSPFEPEYKITDKEERFGCIICPYKTLDYYRFLKRERPLYYYYSMTIRLIASARSIVQEGREYWYEGKIEKGIMVGKCAKELHSLM